MLIDSHCHLNFAAFEKDLKKVIKRAKKAGVVKMVAVGVDEKSSQRAVEIANEYQEVWATVGFHPHHVKGLKNLEEFGKIEKKLEKLAENKRVVAIGECGLDYFRYQKSKYQDFSKTEWQNYQNRQKGVFGRQIQMAKRLGKPMVIHMREAEEDLLDNMDHFCKNDNQYPKGVFHCISGSETYLKKAIKMGFYIGVAGNVSYRKEIQALVKEIPLNKMLLETDAPYLTPEPIRGNHLRNEPVNVKIVAEFIETIKKIPLKKIIASTQKNAEALFKI